MKVIRILVFLLILNSFILAGFLIKNYTGKVVEESKIEYATLTRAIDGDTIDVLMLDNTTQRVRLLGVNTPEKSQKGYQEAKDFLKAFENKTITLEKTAEDKDQYGRILRYIFYNGEFINKEILENSLAHFYTYNEDKYTEELRQAEEQARQNAEGFWEKSQEQCGSCITLIKLNEIDPGEYVQLGNNCSFSCSLQGWRIDDDSSSHTRILNFSIDASGERRIDYNGSIWNDNGDTLYLRDKEGRLALFYRY